MIHNTLALISYRISSFSISYAYSRIPVPSSSLISAISCALSSPRNASTRSARSFSMAKCRGQTLGLLLTCSSRACSIPSIASPFSIRLKQGWLYESLKSVCTAIFSPKESCLPLTTAWLSWQSSPCSSASSFCGIAGSALTAVEMQFLIAAILPMPFSLLQASHLAFATNSQSAGLGALQSPTVACLQRPQSCSLASSVTGCLLADSALAASSNSWTSYYSGTSTACSVSSFVAGFSSCLPKSLLNEFLIKFIICNTTMIPIPDNSILQLQQQLSQPTGHEQASLRTRNKAKAGGAYRCYINCWIGLACILYDSVMIVGNQCLSLASKILSTSSVSSCMDILSSPFQSAILSRLALTASGLRAGFCGSSWGSTSWMNWRTSCGSRKPLPSLSQQLKMALAVISAILHSDDFLLFCIVISNRLWQQPGSLLQVMSKSVRSYGSSSARGREAQEAQHVKDKIKEILYSIKDERQHIENRLYENDVEINRLRRDYELLRYEHDFQHLNEEEAVLVEELKEGLRENSISPQAVMGGKAEAQQFRELSKRQVIEVQQLMIAQLNQLLKP